MSNFNEYNNSQFNPENTFMNNMTNENFINMAQNIDLGNLNGTNILDLHKDNMPPLNTSINNPNNNFISYMQNMPQMNNSVPIKQEKQLIKSITREIINNLKENNISLHDDNTSQNLLDEKYNNSYIDPDNIDDIKDETKDELVKNKHYKNELKKGMEHVLTENGIPASNNITSYLFDDMFNIKDFIVLFGVYFLLSQEMIKDLFAQYFTSLDPDENGKIHVKGVIIYGLILTILFMIIRKFV